MLNKVLLIGNVGADPDVRTMPNGGKVSSFSLATTDYWKDRDGNRKDRTEWHKIVTFLEPLITNIIEPYIKKGSRVYVEGSLKTRKYTDGNSIERYMTEVVVQSFGETIKLLDSRNSVGEQDSSDSGTSYDNRKDGGNSRAKRDLSNPDDKNIASDIDDDIPF